MAEQPTRQTFPTRERIHTTQGRTEVIDGWRHIDCPWLAVTPERDAPGWNITHTPTGACLLGSGGDHDLAPVCGTRDEAIELLERLASEKWLRELKPPAGGEAAERLRTIVHDWRAA